MRPKRRGNRPGAAPDAGARKGDPKKRPKVPPKKGAKRPPPKKAAKGARPPRPDASADAERGASEPAADAPAPDTGKLPPAPAQEDPRVAELMDKVGALSQQLESMGQDRDQVKGVADRFQGMEDRMKSLLQLSEVLSVRYNPFLEEEEPDLYDNRDPSTLLPLPGGPPSPRAARGTEVVPVDDDDVPMAAQQAVPDPPEVIERDPQARPERDVPAAEAISEAASHHASVQEPLVEHAPSVDPEEEEALRLAAQVIASSNAPDLQAPQAEHAEPAPAQTEVSPEASQPAPSVTEPPAEEVRMHPDMAQQMAPEWPELDDIEEQGLAAAVGSTPPAPRSRGTAHAEPAGRQPAADVSRPAIDFEPPVTASAPAPPVPQVPAALPTAAPPRLSYQVLCWFEQLSEQGDPSEIHIFLDQYAALGWIPAEHVGWMRSLAASVAPRRDVSWDDLQMQGVDLARLHRKHLRFLERLFRTGFSDDEPGAWERQASDALGGD